VQIGAFGVGYVTLYVTPKMEVSTMPKIKGIPVPYMTDEQAVMASIKSITDCLFHPWRRAVITGLWIPSHAGPDEINRSAGACP